MNISARLKVLTLITSVSLLFITTSPALAQVASSAATTPGTNSLQLLNARRAQVGQAVGNIGNQIASREAALKARLQKFKDQRKAAVAERINTALARINQNQTTQMSTYLDKLTSILVKLEDRVNSGSPDIKNPTSAKTAIAQAQTAIASASAAVKAQSNKDYTITVNSETTIKSDIQKVKDQLRTDLKATWQQVLAARQAVVNAITVAKSNGGTNGQQ